MRLLIYSDVHGNLPAFETILNEAGCCDAYICLGDLVNYGPWSNECVDLAFSLPNSIIIKGNHEEDFIKGFYPGTNQLVKNFFNTTFPVFKRKEIIAGFVNNYVLNGFTCQHTIENKNIYSNSDIILNTNYIIGHSHHQFKIQNNGYFLYNAGSVGQNRHCINIANYLIYTTDTNTFDLRFAYYNVKFLLNKMKALAYPNECIQYYQRKLCY
jgi:predicted phosphodiesterase